MDMNGPYHLRQDDGVSPTAPARCTDAPFFWGTLPLGKQTTCYTLLSMASMAFGLRFV